MSKIIDIETTNLAQGEFHFNGSIFVAYEKLYLAYRVNNGLNDASIWTNELDKRTLQPIGLPKKLEIPNTMQGHQVKYEDPRVFWCNGKLYCAYTFLRLDNIAQNQGLALLNKNLEVEEVYFIKYKNNHNAAINPKHSRLAGNNSVVRSGGSMKFEKNWQFFEHDKKVHVVYNINRKHTVIEPDLSDCSVRSEYLTNVEIPWEHGAMRGGTPPLKLGDQYYSVFHSSTQEPNQTKIYYAGLYTFEAKPPFRPLRVSAKPILTGNPNDKLVLWHNAAVFPCGALYMGEYWLISYGYNDHSLKILKISHKELVDDLIQIK